MMSAMMKKKTTMMMMMMIMMMMIVTVLMKMIITVLKLLLIMIVIEMREREMFYLTTHSTHFIYGYMASDIWSRTILIGYSYRLTARVLLYAPSHRQDNTYHGLCYTSRGSLVGMRNSSN